MKYEILLGNDGTTAQPNILLLYLLTNKTLDWITIDPYYLWTGDSSKVKIEWGEWEQENLFKFEIFCCLRSKSIILPCATCIV